MEKNFENFGDLHYALNFIFSIICFSETWADDSFGENSLYQLKNITSYTRLGMVAKEEDSVSLFMNIFVTAFAKTCV